jgi:hypothetical protein
MFAILKLNYKVCAYHWEFAKAYWFFSVDIEIGFNLLVLAFKLIDFGLNHFPSLVFHFSFIGYEHAWFFSLK